MISLPCGILKKVKLTEESRMVVDRDEGKGEEERGRCGSRGANFEYKMNKFWGVDIAW